MDTGESTRYARLFGYVERDKQSLGETAARFPVSKEEYLDKPLDERMQVAMDIIRTYAEMGQYSPGPVRVDITPDDRPGMVLTGEVGYIPEEKYSISNHIPRLDYECINVSVGAKDVATGIETNRNQRLGLGKIRQGCYIGDSGKIQEGWVVFLDDRQGKFLSLSGQLGQQLVEFVDAGVSGLIEGKISEHRKLLGNQALQGAAS